VPANITQSDIPATVTGLGERKDSTLSCTIGVKLNLKKPRYKLPPPPSNGWNRGNQFTVSFGNILTGELMITISEFPCSQIDSIEDQIKFIILNCGLHGARYGFSVRIVYTCQHKLAPIPYRNFLDNLKSIPTLATCRLTQTGASVLYDDNPNFRLRVEETHFSLEACVKVLGPAGTLWEQVMDLFADYQPLGNDSDATEDGIPVVPEKKPPQKKRPRRKIVMGKRQCVSTGIHCDMNEPSTPTAVSALMNNLIRLEIRDLKNIAHALGLVTSRSRAKHPYLIQLIRDHLKNDPRQLVVQRLVDELLTEASSTLKFLLAKKASLKTKCTSGLKKRGDRSMLLNHSSSSAFKSVRPSIKK
jgi:hypothetical protein